MSLIMGRIEAEHPELLSLEFGKIAKSDFFYALASTNINQSAPNLVKVYMTIRSEMNSIISNINQSAPNSVKVYITIRSGMNSIMDLICP